MHYVDMLQMAPQELKTYRANYFQRYGVENHLLIWVDISTSWTELYLDLKRWIVFIEDDAGNQHEPEKVIEEPESSFSDSTDIFPGLPREAEFRRTAFHQKRLMLCFPKQDFDGNPILSEKVRFLKLVFQQSDDRKTKAEGVWVFKK